MKTIELSKTSGEILQYAKKLKGNALIFTEHGVPSYAMYKLDKEEIERLKLAGNKKFNAILQKSKRALRSSGGVSVDSLE